MNHNSIKFWCTNILQPILFARNQRCDSEKEMLGWVNGTALHQFHECYNKRCMDYELQIVNKDQMALMKM